MDTSSVTLHPSATARRNGHAIASANPGSADDSSSMWSERQRRPPVPRRAVVPTPAGVREKFTPLGI